MPEIIFPTQVTTAQALFAQDLEAHEVFLRARENRGTLFPDAPYCMPGESPDQGAILNELKQIPPPQRAPLMRALDNFGDQVVTLADIYAQHLMDLDLQETVSLTGAGATARGARLNGFQQAIVNYQGALLELHQHQRAGRGDAQKVILERRVRQRYATLQTRYRLELGKAVPPQAVGKNRGDALTSADRGVTLARRRRSRKLYVANTQHAQHLKHMASGIRFSGNGLLVLDAGIRANKVRAVHHQGGDWQREMAMQVTGFGAAGIAGLTIGKGFIVGLTAVGLGLTPVGWVVLIGIGVGAGFWAGHFADGKAQDIAGRIYDRAW